MRKLLLSAFLTFTPLLLLGQSILDDAIYLKKTSHIGTRELTLGDSDFERVYALLTSYFPELDEVGYNADEVRCELQKNPFFKNYTSFAGREESEMTDAERKKSLHAISGYTDRVTSKSFSGTDISSLAFGMADFLIERTKWELNAAFFKTFAKELDNSDLKHLFPVTAETLASIGTQIYQFDLYINLLRDAFEQDLSNMLENLTAYISRSQKQLSHTNAKMLLSLSIAKWIKNDLHPGVLLDSLVNSNPLAAIEQKSPSISTRNTINYIKLLGFISNSLRGAAGGGSYWTSTENIKMLNDSITLRLYMGLLYQRYINDSIQIEFVVEDSVVHFEDAMRALADKWIEVSANAQSAGVAIGYMVERLKSIEQKMINFKSSSIATSLNISINSTEKSKALSNIALGKTRSYLEALELSFILQIFVNQPERIASVDEISLLIPHFFNEVAHIGALLENKQYALAVAKALPIVGSMAKADKEPEVKAKFLKYGVFMASLVSAQDPQQAKAAIEAAALPPGSYIIKRESSFSVTLNGYLGLFGGSEQIKNIDKSFAINNAALSAPIGLYFGWGKTSRLFPNSVGFFIPVIDLGTLASYRFNNPDVEDVPSVSLRHLVAPGLFVEFGVGNTPLSLGVGVQVGPRLREVDSSITNAGDMYWRVGATLKVDIPILNLKVTP